MSETPEPSKAESASERGVFGNLPDARPGTRSPRRKSAKVAVEKPTSKPKPKVAKPPPAQAPPPPPPPPVDAHRPAGEQQPGGLADVAWAGIAVAAEAATIGVRLASRAIEAVRGNSERD